MPVYVMSIFILFNLLECMRMLFIYTCYVWLMRFLA